MDLLPILLMSPFLVFQLYKLRRGQYSSWELDRPWPYRSLSYFFFFLHSVTHYFPWFMINIPTILDDIASNPFPLY